MGLKSCIYYSPLYLEGIMIDTKIEQASIAPPEGGRIYILHDVLVDESRTWSGALRAAGPDTPDTYDIWEWEVGNQYLLTSGESKRCEVVLANFGPGYTLLAKTIEWGESNGLSQASPRTVFAVAEHSPRLQQDLKVNPMWVLSAEECVLDDDRRVCFVWFDGAGRESGLGWVDDGVGDLAWVAFVREAS